jgi:hypothetical protein
VIRYDKLAPALVDDPMPIARSALSDLDATANALGRDRPERLASQFDRDARRVNALASAMRLDQIEMALERDRADRPIFERVLSERLQIVGLRGVTSPQPDVVQHLGPRPLEREPRRVWDAAAGAIAIHRERNQLGPSSGPGVELVLGARPQDAGAAEHYARLAALIERVAPVPALAPDLGGEEQAAGVGVSPHPQLGDAELRAELRELRAWVDDRAAELRHLQRGMDLRVSARDERLASGGDVAAFDRQITDLRADWEAVATEHRGLARALVELQSEAERRGIDEDSDDLTSGEEGRCALPEEEWLAPTVSLVEIRSLEVE